MSFVLSVAVPPITMAVGLQAHEKILNALAWQIPLGLMGVIFVFRLAPAPYWMFKDDEAKRDIEQAEKKKRHGELMAQLSEMKALLAERFNREEKKSCLAWLLRDGKQLKDRRVQDTEQLKGWTPDFQEWIGRVESEVREKFSDADSLRLSTLDYDIVPVPGVASGDHQRAVCRITDVLKELQTMFHDLSTRGRSGSVSV